jgi:hypothetical protein
MKDKDKQIFYLVHKDKNGWEEIRSRTTGKLLTWKTKESCQIAKCKMFGIGKSNIKMIELWPNNIKLIVKDWSK